LFIVGFDEKKRDSEYFKRIMPTQRGINRYEFNMPLSPPVLTVIIFDLQTGFQKIPTHWKKVNFYQTTLPQVQTNFDKKTREFIKLNNEFCQNAGWIPANRTYYDQPNKYFEFVYLPNIEGDYTPARIHKTEDFIQISQKQFRRLTIPNRWLINSHEYSHNFVNDNRDSEKESDINGMALYLSQGFPYIEGIYTFTRILSDSPYSEERIEFIYNFLNEHRTETWRGVELW